MVSSLAARGQRCCRMLNTSVIPSHEAELDVSKENLSSITTEEAGYIDSNSLVTCTWLDGAW